MPVVQAGSKYKITNVKGGTAIDISGVDNKTVIGYGYHGGGNQQWEVERAGDKFRLKSGTGLYLGVEGQVNDGTAVVATSNPFDWQIMPDEKNNSFQRLAIPNSNKNLDLADHGNSAPGTPVTVWSKWDGQNQTWNFEQV